MKIYNSLGSNYSKALLIPRSRQSAPADLKAYLTKHYAAKKVMLTYKGREAIALVLKHLSLPKGSFVAVNGFTCYAVYQGIAAAGLKPYYLDIPKDGLNFTAETLQRAIEEEPRIVAVMVQNTLGLPCDMPAIETICKQRKLPIIEDLAHSVGVVYSDGREAGKVGQAVALSFSQDKVIDAVTGGAAVWRVRSDATDDTFLPANRWHRFTTHLYPRASWLIRQTIPLGIGRVLLKGMKISRLLPGPMSGNATQPHCLPVWHASLALQSYKHLPAQIRHRQEIAKVYRETLSQKLQIPHVEGAVYLRFPILLSDPSDLIQHLKQFGIYVGDRWYDAPVAPKAKQSQAEYRVGSCPQAELVAKQIVNLPTHGKVSQQMAAVIAEKVNQWLK